MGNEISSESRSTDTTTEPVTLNEPLKSSTRICESSQSSNITLPIEQAPDPKNWVTEIGEKNIVRNLCDSSDDRSPMSSFSEIGLEIPKPRIEDLGMKYMLADEDEQGQDFRQKQFTSGNYEQEYEKKLKSIQQTLKSLDDNLHETRSLETEKSLRYSQSKTKNMSLQVDLDKANKRNKNMLNLFRQNAAEIGFGRLKTSSTLPEFLKRDVQRIWSHKYDALLAQNNQLKKEAALAEFSSKEKDMQIGDLQQRLLNLAEDLIQRDKTIEKICTKFLLLKQRKDEQEVLLRG